MEFFEEKMEGKDYRSDLLPKGTYENCTFKKCHFNGADIRKISFVDCHFEESDLSTANTSLAAFKNVSFKDCKLLGIRFDTCNDFLFEVRFDNCQLNLSSFYGMKLQRTMFNRCNLTEVDFVATNLSESTFDFCELTGVQFENSNLEKADFRTSTNFAIDPRQNSIKGAKFSRNNIEGLLYAFDIILE